MRKINTAHIFVSPSLTSGTIVILGAVLLLLILNSTLLQNGGFWTSLLLGQDSSTGLIEVAQTTSFNLSELTLGNPTLNKFLFFGFWMFVGLVVYVSLMTVGTVFGEVGQAVEDIKLAQHRREHLADRSVLRATIRVASLLGLLLFYLVFARLILPFAVLASRAWLSSFNSVTGWLYGALGFVVLILALHIFVILLRLLALRPRVFGGWDVFA